jgi:hypothetical protein
LTADGLARTLFRLILTAPIRGARNVPYIQLAGIRMSTTTPSAKPLIRLWSAASHPPRMHQPLLYSIDEALGVIFIDLLTVGDAAAVVQALQRIRLNPSFRRDLSVCVDCRFLSRAPDMEDVRAIAKLWPRGAMGDLTGRCAVVASVPWTYGAARTFAAFAGSRTGRVCLFRACADALIWVTG